MNSQEYLNRTEKIIQRYEQMKRIIYSLLETMDSKSADSKEITMIMSNIENEEEK